MCYMSAPEINHIVVPDRHGEYDRTARMVDYFGLDGNQFVFLGDLLDRGKDAARLVAFVRSLGDHAITIAANHEWTTRNALAENGTTNVEVWREEVWPRYESGLLESYGCDKSWNWNINAERLRETMQETGDLDWLNSLPPYFEGDEFIALHAGPSPHMTWEEQKHQLDVASHPRLRTFNEPAQIFSHDLAGIVDIPDIVDGRIFVTGHVHFSNLPAESRRAQNRVCLASGASEPLFVYESLVDRIHTLSP